MIGILRGDYQHGEARFLGEDGQHEAQRCAERQRRPRWGGVRPGRGVGGGEADEGQQREERGEQLGAPRHIGHRLDVHGVRSEEQAAQRRAPAGARAADAAAAGGEDHQRADAAVQREVHRVEARRRQLVRVVVELQRRDGDGAPRSVRARVLQRRPPVVVGEQRRPAGLWAQVLVLDDQGSVVVQQPAAQPRGAAPHPERRGRQRRRPRRPDAVPPKEQPCQAGARHARQRARHRRRH
eukprot:COSAG04_NODE_953_length_9207_cov_15.426987_1_plen_238_part_10